MLTHYGRPVVVLAVSFAAVAGFVDAIGFLLTGGFFVSFMSGNTTRLAIGVASGSAAAGVAAGLIALFVGGVVLGSLAGRWVPARRQPAVLLLVTLLLAIAALVDATGGGRRAVIPMVLAMGAENTVFAEDGEVRIGLTYMTGTLVKTGKRLAAALVGGDRWGWLPYLLLWAGLLAGAVVGALVFRRAGAEALWAAVGAMAGLTVVAARMDLTARAVPRILVEAPLAP